MALLKHRGITRASYDALIAPDPNTEYTVLEMDGTFARYIGNKEIIPKSAFRKSGGILLGDVDANNNKIINAVIENSIINVENPTEDMNPVNLQYFKNIDNLPKYLTAKDFIENEELQLLGLPWISQGLTVKVKNFVYDSENTNKSYSFYITDARKNQNGQSVDYNYKAFYVEDGQLYEDETNCDESSVLYRAEKNYPETIENLFTLMFSDNNELLIKNLGTTPLTFLVNVYDYELDEYTYYTEAEVLNPSIAQVTDLDYFIDGNLIFTRNKKTILGLIDTSVESIIIPNGVENIANYAFYNTSLITVELPQTLKTLGRFAFYGCQNLENIVLPNGLQKIGPYALSRVKVQSFQVPDTVEIIEEAAFQNNSALTSIKLPKNLETLSRHTFSGCTSLEEIIWSEELKTIDSSAFYACTSLINVVLPDTLRSIKEYAFGLCNNLQSIILPDNLEEIGNSVFISCTALEEILIPNTVSTIGMGAFSSCTSLHTANIPTSLEIIPDQIFFGTALETIIIPNNILQIGNGAFNNCSQLTTVQFSSNLEVIGEHAFRSCVLLSVINLPNSLTTIKQYAFFGCYALVIDRLPEVENIENNAFGDLRMPEGTTVIIPAGITNLGQRVLANSANGRNPEIYILNCVDESKPAGWNLGWDYAAIQTNIRHTVNWGYEE